MVPWFLRYKACVAIRTTLMSCQAWTSWGGTAPDLDVTISLSCQAWTRWGGTAQSATRRGRERQFCPGETLQTKRIKDGHHPLQLRPGLLLCLHRQVPPEAWQGRQWALGLELYVQYIPILQRYRHVTSLIQCVLSIDIRKLFQIELVRQIH